MLVLTRRLNQSIMIGEIEVTVIEVRGDQVRLGIHAPKDVPVHRKEIYLQVQEENRASAAAAKRNYPLLAIRLLRPSGSNARSRQTTSFQQIQGGSTHLQGIYPSQTINPA